MYDYLFYFLYRFFSYIDEDRSIIIAFGVLWWLNFFNIFSLFGFYLMRHPDIRYAIHGYHGVILGLLLLTINYLIFFRKHRYVQVFNKYENEQKVKFIFRSILTSTYIILTIWVCFYIVLPNVAEIAKMP